MCFAIHLYGESWLFYKMSLASCRLLLFFAGTAGTILFRLREVVYVYTTDVVSYGERERERERERKDIQIQAAADTFRRRLQTFFLPPPFQRERENPFPTRHCSVCVCATYQRQVRNRRVETFIRRQKKFCVSGLGSKYWTDVYLCGLADIPRHGS